MVLAAGHQFASADPCQRCWLHIKQLLQPPVVTLLAQLLTRSRCGSPDSWALLELGNDALRLHAGASRAAGADLSAHGMRMLVFLAARYLAQLAALLCLL